MSSIKAGGSTIALTPSVTHVAKEGYLVTFSGDTATLSASASVPASGVILNGEATTSRDTIAILGCHNEAVHMKASGTITKGAFVQQHTDGSVITDAATGARVVVGVAAESAVSGDLFMVFPITPRVYAS